MYSCALMVRCQDTTMTKRNGKEKKEEMSDFYFN